MNAAELIEVARATLPAAAAEAWIGLLRPAFELRRAGVGEAVGRAVRTSMVVAAVEIVMISLAVYGQSGNFNLAG